MDDITILQNLRVQVMNKGGRRNNNRKSNRKQNRKSNRKQNRKSNRKSNRKTEETNKVKFKNLKYNIYIIKYFII